MQDLPQVVADDEKAVQNTKRDRWDGEEIHCSNCLPMVSAVARMWEAFIEGIGWDTNIFPSITEAQYWVRIRVKEKFHLDIP
jgi:hypothetical protein